MLTDTSVLTDISVLTDASVLTDTSCRLRRQEASHLFDNPKSDKMMSLLYGKLRKATISFVMSVCVCAWNNSATTRQIYMEF